MFANPQTIQLALSLQSALDSSPRELYVLTAVADGSNNPRLQSKRVALNGKPLTFVGPDQASLPQMSPLKKPGGSRNLLPALSYRFIALPLVSTAACQ